MWSICAKSPEPNRACVLCRRRRLQRLPRCVEEPPCAPRPGGAQSTRSAKALQPCGPVGSQGYESGARLRIRPGAEVGALRCAAWAHAARAGGAGGAGGGAAVAVNRCRGRSSGPRGTGAPPRHAMRIRTAGRWCFCSATLSRRRRCESITGRSIDRSICVAAGEDSARRCRGDDAQNRRIRAGPPGPR